VPSVSKKQRNFMAAAAHNPAFAKKVGISQDVAKEFNKADKGRKFREGGAMKHEDVKLDKKIVKKAVKMHDDQLHGGKKTNLSKLAKGGVAKTVTKEMEYDYKTGKKSFGGTTAQRDAHAEKEGKRVAKDLAYDKGMKKGGMCKGYAEGGDVSAKPSQGSGYDSDPFVKLRKKIFGEDKKKASEDSGYKAGGKVRGCGMATKGLTKGRMV